jgi:hypothetical protein
MFWESSQSRAQVEMYLFSSLPRDKKILRLSVIVGQKHFEVEQVD